MHFNTILPFTCLLLTLASAAPIPLSPVYALAPSALAQREPGALEFDGGKALCFP